MKILENVSLKELTTLKIGGTARYFFSAREAEELKSAFAFAKEKKVPVVVLGGGSNVLIGGGEIRALVIKIDVKGVTWKDEGDTVVVIAGAGESWDALVAEAIRKELWGIENLSGIPGSVGATPIQNIGAYGTEIQDAVEWVEVFDANTGEVKKVEAKDCQFFYRDSLFKKPEGKSLVVLRIALRLRKNGVPNLEYKDLKNHFAGKPTPSLSEIRTAILNIRGGKFPDLKTHGTAGSFFKNPIIPKAQFDELKKKFPDLPGFPLGLSLSLEGENQRGGAHPTSILPSKEGRREDKVKIPLAWILDNICKLKGHKKGNVALFERQPIVLVQSGAASAEEIEAFAKEVADAVRAETGIEIEWEVQKIF